MQPHEKPAAAREALAALLQADPLFARPALPVPVITEDKGDIETQITDAIARLGLCAIVVAADGGIRHGNRSLSLILNLVIQISEDVLMNNEAAQTAGVAPVRALDLATAALRAAHGAPNGLGDPSRGLNRFSLDENPLALIPDAPVTTYHVRCKTLVSLGP
jgi:hypothetical protein